ncbi:putative DNA-directed RNA polymerase III RPC4 [Emericellopsis atlantica]|uniref:DNA-directed RNA polymerase III RPC4 n=1 Tax=Emericellopsis atlantica TaxID=2614577 RepID=A0A9P7ZP77_9HYPO|nr:putative DNA-directed RNA polymerase III RPC4 [Emericellopsis atlantica]KAG9255306.1 putative DNA-directed RNA polymerase III RPC4 [Emericellopsis atlantica]
MNRGSRGTARGRAGAAASRDATPRTTPAASSTPTPGRTTPSALGRTPSTTRGGRGASAPTTGRFRPKNIRRDESERDIMAREEEKKASARAAEEKKARGRARGRSKKTRGDTMGSRGNRMGMTSSSGLFSGGDSRSGGGWGGGGGGGGGGGFASSYTSGGGPSRSRGQAGFREGTSAPWDKRINADKLHNPQPDQEIDSADEEMMEAIGKKMDVMPMGIFRKKHKETEVVVATTAELEAAENAGEAVAVAPEEEESLWVEDDTDQDKPSTTEVTTEDEEKADSMQGIVKKEAEDEDVMDLEEKVKQKVKDAVKKEKPKVEIKVKKPPQDPEERVIQSDLDLLAGELGAVTMDGGAQTENPANKDGRMYLFQFPPLLPPLKPGPQPHAEGRVKPESNEISMSDVPAADPAQVDLTGGNDDADGAEENEKGEDDPEEENGFMSSLLTQGGMVGKMVVRKSGKVELDWGGRVLEMSPATGMNFTTTAVIVEENDEKAATGAVGGDGIGMGKIMGRFVLAPVWGEEEEWNVAPEELVVNQSADGDAL